MKLRSDEIDYLSAWAREEKATDPYMLPAHRLQADHQVPSVTLIRAIKAWARSEGKRDEDIFVQPGAPNPLWPWSSPTRLEEILSDQHESRQAS